MADYGLLPTGFVRQRLPEIQAAIVTDLKSRTLLDFDTDPTSVTGQFIAIFAEREAALWEVAQAVYSAMYPPSAFGNALDDAVSFVGVRRIPASRTEVVGVLYGTQGAVIPADSVVRSAQSSGNYLLDEAVTISAANAADVKLSITAVNSTLYTVTIDGVTYSFTSDASATKGEIATGLAAALVPTGLTIDATAGTDGFLRLTQPVGEAFAITLSANLAVALLGSPGLFYRQDVGAVIPPVGTLTNIITTASGWDSINNPVDALIGRLEETDAELRSRYQLGVFRTGAGNINSIAANLLAQIKNIQYAAVYENKTNATDSFSRPAHSVEAVVMGGNNQEICNLLFQQVAAGIETYGNFTGTAVGTQGNTQTIKFSRPVVVKCWLKINITKYTEEALPDNAAALIAETAVAIGKTFGVGKDVILQRFFGPIFAALPGIATIAVTVATGTAPLSGDYVATNLAVDLRSITDWDATRVSVTIAP